jgi:hypothetical protein
MQPHLVQRSTSLEIRAIGRNAQSQQQRNEVCVASLRRVEKHFALDLLQKDQVH